MEIYLDNASTTPMDSRVFDAMKPYMLERYGNPGGVYLIGKIAADAVEKAREQVAALIGASPEQIVFTSGGTEANNMVLRGAGNLDASKSIIVGQTEHDSVLYSAQHSGRKVVSIDGLHDSDGRIKVDVLEKNIGADTVLVSAMHTNNETGIVNPVEEIGKLCNKRKVLFHTDCVQALGTHRLDMQKIGCDFASFSSHKIHGPKGVGALFVKDKASIAPLIYGGRRQEFGLRGGTENVAGIVGFGAACEILNQQLERDAAYCTQLISRLYEGICSGLTKSRIAKAATLNAMEPTGTKILNMRFKEIDGQTFVALLYTFGMAASAGSACNSHESKPSRVLLAMGLDAEDAHNSVRFSVSRMNTEKEIDRAASQIVGAVNVIIPEITRRRLMLGL